MPNRQTSKKFRDWVRNYGVRAFARALHVKHPAVVQWLNGETRPNADRIADIMQIARTTKVNITPADCGYDL